MSAERRGGTPGSPTSPLLASVSVRLFRAEPALAATAPTLPLASWASRRAKPGSGGDSLRPSIGATAWTRTQRYPGRRPDLLGRARSLLRHAHYAIRGVVSRSLSGRP